MAIATELKLDNCLVCGYPVNHHGNFCPQCGRPVSIPYKYTVGSVVTDIVNKHDKKILVGLVVFIIALILAFFVVPRAVAGSMSEEEFLGIEGIHLATENGTYGVDLPDNFTGVKYQGNNDFSFESTCYSCSIANAMNMRGGIQVNENDVVRYANATNQIDKTDGGMNSFAAVNILNHNGIKNELHAPHLGNVMSFGDIMRYVCESKRPAILSVSSNAFYNNYDEGDCGHALVVYGCNIGENGATVLIYDSNSGYVTRSYDEAKKAYTAVMAPSVVLVNW